MGPMCTPEVLTRTQEHLDDATAKGATIVLGGGHEGQFHEADDRRRRHERHADRAGGDLRSRSRPIITFSTLDEALEIANETEYGLTASVFTKSLHDAWRAAEELRHGTVHINETTNYWDQLAPFGGAK